jgi:hypothetical protein
VSLVIYYLCDANKIFSSRLIVYLYIFLINIGICMDISICMKNSLQIGK